MYWQKDKGLRGKGGIKVFTREGELRVRREELQRFKSELESKGEEDDDESPIDKLLREQEMRRLRGRIGGYERSWRMSPEEMGAHLHFADQVDSVTDWLYTWLLSVSFQERYCYMVAVQIGASFSIKHHKTGGDMTEILTSVASSLLVGMLSWGGSQLLTWYKQGHPQKQTVMPATGNPAYGPMPSTVLSGQPAAPSVNFSIVLIHIGILQFLVNIVGLVVGIFSAVLGLNSGVYLVVLFFVGTLAASSIFFIFGRRVDRAVRWRHLTYVTLGTIPLTLLVNALAFYVQGKTLYTSMAEFIFAVIISAFQTFLAMGIGGGLASLFDPKRGLQAPAPPMSPQYMPHAPNPAYPAAYPPNPAYPAAYPPNPAYPAAYPPNPAYPAAYPPNPAYPAAYPPNPAYPAAYPAYPPYPPNPAGYPPNPAYPPMPAAAPGESPPNNTSDSTNPSQTNPQTPAAYPPPASETS